MLFWPMSFFLQEKHPTLAFFFSHFLIGYIYKINKYNQNHMHTRNIPNTPNTSHLCPYNMTQKICNDTNLT